MNDYTSLTNAELITSLKGGGIGVIRTDTLYGLVTLASNEAAVQRVYNVKGRDEKKSPIVLIADPLQMFDAVPSELEQIIAESWPGKTSIIVPSIQAPEWITRGNGSVAYRLPAHDQLRALLRETGPLIAPSANPEGRHPAMTIEEAKVYFGKTIDFYVDGGEIDDDSPSKLIRLSKDGTVERLR